MFRIASQFIATIYTDAQREQREWVSDDAKGFDWEAVSVLITVALALTWRYYFNVGAGLWSLSADWLPPSIGAAFQEWASVAENRELARLADWVFSQTVAFLAAPLLCCLWLRKQPSGYGCKLGGASQGWPLYLLMFAIMLPAIVVVSRTSMFQSAYPFYALGPQESLWPRLIIWELLYAWQFIVLEFFFRGFMVHGLKKRFGFYAVFVMAIPYCMIHFGKPYPETVASIVAGVALGVMSLRTRSIWLGAALHIAVAWTMDFAALFMTGRL